MRKLLIAALLALAALPAVAADLAAQKQDMQQNSRQETIALGNNQFLLFSGAKSPFQYIWSIERIEVTGGVPKLLPLFMEEYDRDAKTLSIAEGIGFPALEYHFDPASGKLTIGARDIEPNIRYYSKYKLVGDTFTLLEVTSQDVSQCPEPSCKGVAPTVLFSAEGQNAQTH